MAEEKKPEAAKTEQKKKPVAKMASLTDANKALSAEVSAKYKVVEWNKNTGIKIHHTKYGIINLKKITVKKVEALIKMKCPIFEKK